MRVNTKEKPCLNCRKKKDPANCDKKNCQVWQIWFVSRWDAMRKAVLKDGT